jgi:hypothetical protein
MLDHFGLVVRNLVSGDDMPRVPRTAPRSSNVAGRPAIAGRTYTELLVATTDPEVRPLNEGVPRPAEQPASDRGALESETRLVHRRRFTRQFRDANALEPHARVSAC